MSIDEQLKTVHLRLGDLVAFYTAIFSISSLSSSEKNSALLSYLNSSQFWAMTYGAFQTAIFINIYALVDTSKDSVSYHHIALQLREKNSEPVDKLLEEIKVIQDRYGRYRHKIFAHTDKGWGGRLGEEFDDANFTWDSIFADIKKLEHVQQNLLALLEGRPLPARDETANSFSFNHLRTKAIVSNAEQLMSWILRALHEGIVTQSNETLRDDKE